MAAAPKLSPEKWSAVREKWEADQRTGFPWVQREMGLPVSSEAVRQRARSESWAKIGADGMQHTKLGAKNPKLGKVVARKTQPGSDGGFEDRPQQLGQGQLLNSRKPTPFMDALTPRERVFVIEYARTGNGTQSAIAAGYAEASAKVTASRLLTRDNIKEALREFMQERVENVGWDVERVLQHYADVAEVDTGKITQHRIRACRHCWGIGFAYQCTPAEYPSKKADHTIRRAGKLESGGVAADIGEFPSIEGDWYDFNREPNPACPECGGTGVAYTWFADTRTLTGRERKVLKGVKRTKDGIEVVIQDPEAAVDKLAKALGLGREDDGPMQTPTEVAMSLVERMAISRKIARQKQDAVYRERGITRTDRGNDDDAQ